MECPLCGIEYGKCWHYVCRDCGIRRWHETRGAQFGRGTWNPGPPLPFPKDPPRD